MPQYLLGIDSGGTMTKTALFSLSGDEVAAEFSPLTMLFPEPGFVERDPLLMWEATCKAINSILQKTGISNSDIIAVSATGYGSGIFCVDKNGLPTCNGVISTDGRGKDISADWESAGLTELARKTLAAEPTWPAQTLTLLGWIQKHRPEIAASTTTVLACKDYTKLRLTGCLSTDVTDAAVGGLLDMQAGVYATDLMIKLGLEQWIDKLPELVQPHSIAGEVSAEAAEQTGLAAGTPVVTGAVDIVCSCVASGVLDSSMLSIVAGTWSINNAIRHDHPQTTDVPLLQMPFLLERTFLACEASPTSASNLEWSCNHVFDAERVAAAEAGESVYERCGRMVKSKRDNPPDVVFLPYLFGSPRNELAGFVGLKAQHERADMVYAVYEGIVYEHKRNIDMLLASSDNQTPDCIRLSGGAARSDIWPQLFADITGLPVEIAAGTEFGAMGTSICAAVATGHYSSYQEAVGQMVSINTRYEPDTAFADRHQERYERFIRIGTAIAQSW